MTIFVMVYGCACGCRVVMKCSDAELDLIQWKKGLTTVPCPFCKQGIWEEKRIEKYVDCIDTHIERWIERTPDMKME